MPLVAARRLAGRGDSAGAGPPPGVEGRPRGAFLPLASAWHRVGWTGVDLFFVLSGYLVGGLLLEESQASGRIDIRRFLARRAFKIWPSYYAPLLLLAVLTAWVSLLPDALWPLVAHARNYVGRADLLAPHAWSLAVEEHCDRLEGGGYPCSRSLP
jgi:peptidoglycan/LPS O-acetylase OafA/YrhL